MFLCYICNHCLILAIFMACSGETFGNGKKRNSPLVEASQPIVSAYREPSVQIFSKRNGNPIFVKEEENVTLVCEATGHPKPKIIWTFTSQSLKKRNLNKKKSSLFISRLSRYDQSRVTCIATNGIGRPASATKRIRVLYLDKPELTVQTSRGDVSPKSIWYQNSVYFRCEVTSEAEVTYTWTFNRVPVPFENENRIFLEMFGKNKAATRLRIKSAKLSDEGRYECIASLGSLGKQFKVPDTRSSFNYKLDIGERTKYVTTNPSESTQVQILSNSPIVVNKGERIKVECQAVLGKPRPFLTWVRSNGKIMANKAIGRNVLVIENASYSDTGSYYCFGANHVGVASKEKINIYVRRLGSMSYWITPQTFAGSPEIPRWRLVENSDVRLTCNAKADPRFELLYSWYKMDHQSRRIRLSPPDVPGLKVSLIKKEIKRSFIIPAMSSRLEIESLSRDDYGIYVCSATLRGFHNSSIEVNATIAIGRDSGPSQITAASAFPLEVIEGKNATLSCLASSTPKPLMLFYRADNGTLSSGKKMEVSKDGNLILRNVTREDEGSYLCKAARFNGFTRRAERQTEAYIDLVVLTPPSVYKNYFDIRKPIGSMLDMICAVTYAKPTDSLNFQWFKDGVSQGKTSLNDQMQITSISENHYGVYVCNVSNAVGTTSCVFNVSNRPYAPEFYYLNPRPLVVENQNSYSYFLSWTQRLPSAVEPVVACKVAWRLRGSPTWINGTVRMPDGAQYGELMTFKLTNLKTGVYEIVVTPMTSRTAGDPAKRFVDVHLRTLRNVLPISTSYNLGAYFYIESSNTKKGDQARLISPRFFYYGDSKGYCLKFYYHMKGQHIGKLRVLLLNSSANETVLWSREKEQGPAWFSGLKTFYTSSDYQIVFEATILEDNGYQGDIAIDDISLEPLPCVTPPTTVIASNRRNSSNNSAASSTKIVFFLSIFSSTAIYFQTLLLCEILQFILITEYIAGPS